MGRAMTPVLEVRNITKRFPGVLANDHISFTLEAGEIHTFLGENGAGKSTLMNILYGLYDPDEGEIFINGKQVTIHGPNDAIRQGLGMVHQHFMLVPTLTVAENVMLGTEITNGWLLDERTANTRIRDLSRQYGLDVPPDALIMDLPVGVQQRVEIVKALYRGADMLILDEPTAVLTPQEGDEVLEVQDLRVLDDRRTVAVDKLSLHVRAGEVLGIAGVQGNGQTELVEALTGLRAVVSGHVRLLGNDVTGATPRTILETGVAHIPEDRHRHGLVLSYPIADNLVLSTYYHEPFAHGVRVDAEAIDQNAQRLVKEFDVRTPSTLTLAASLSGGNQQKVVVAREFSRPIKLLIAAQPTRGLDVGSIEFIHNGIIRQRDEGVAVLVVSAELDEILALSDRIAVMFKGQIIADVPAAEATREGLGLLMAGIVGDSAGLPIGEEAHVHRA